MLWTHRTNSPTLWVCQNPQITRTSMAARFVPAWMGNFGLVTHPLVGALRSNYVNSARLWWFASNTHYTGAWMVFGVELLQDTEKK